MPKLSDRKDDQRFFAMFVGRHHSGKTVAEASFPKPLHIEDFDGRVDGAQVPWLSMEGITYDYWQPKQPNLIGKLNEKFDNMLTAAQIQTPGSVIQLPKTHVTDSITNQSHAFLSQAVSLTHMREGDDGKRKKAGRWLGPVQMAGPEDFGMQSSAMYDYVGFLKSLPIQNVILSAHLVDMYGFQKDEDDDDMPYAPKVVVGQKLSITDKIGENIQTSFSHVFKFERDQAPKADKFFVTFRGGIACTSYDWLPYGRHDWTGKNFYEFMFSFRKDKANVAPPVK